MVFRLWLRRLASGWFFASSGRRKSGCDPRANRRRVRPDLEGLEARTVPTVFSPVAAGDVTTLIADINAANGAVGGSTIDLTAGTYDLTAIDNYWYGPNGLPAITCNLTINGNGATIERDNSAPDFRLFYVSGGLSGLPGGDLTLNNLTLEGGVARGGNAVGGGGGLGAGGAIFNQGTVALNGVTVVGNTAQGGNSGTDPNGRGGGGGGIGQDAQGTTGGGFGSGFPTGSYGGKGGSGGTIYEAAGGGGFSADGQNDSNGAGSGGGQSGLGGNGGGMSGATGGDGGGGADVYGYGGAGGDFGFGGIGQGSSAGGGGGGVGGGGGSGFNGGGGSGGGGGFGGGGGEFVSGASGGLVGGGLAGFGGGDGRRTSFGAGGGDGGFGGGGGGGEGGAGGAGGGMGGAVFNMYGTLTVTNCTLTGNTAQGGNGYGGGSGFGGAIFNLDGTVNLTFSTLAANTVAAGTANGGTAGSADGGALYNLAYGHTPDGMAVTASSTLVNSILSNTQGGTHDLVNDQDTRAGFGDGTATVDASAPNLIMAQAALDGTTILGTPLTADPKLGVLANNGGPTPTMALLPGSPAIGAGSQANAPATDQRGEPRPASGALDLGAYEAVPTPIVLSPAALPSGTANASYDQTITAGGGSGTVSVTYQLAANNSIPAGLTFVVSGTELVISGTPAAAGTVSFAVTASDHAGDTATQNYTLTVNTVNTVSPPAAPPPAPAPEPIQQGRQDVVWLAASALSGDVSLFARAMSDYHALPPTAQQEVLQTVTRDLLQLVFSGRAQDVRAVEALVLVDLLLTYHLL